MQALPFKQLNKLFAITLIMSVSRTSAQNEIPAKKESSHVYVLAGLGIQATAYYGTGYQYSLGGKKRDNYLGLEAGYLSDIGRYRGFGVMAVYTNEGRGLPMGYFTLKLGYAFAEDPYILANAAYGITIPIRKRFQIFGDIGLGTAHLLSLGMRVKLL